MCHFYKSPSQAADEFDNFLNKLNLTTESVTQKNRFLTVAIGHFNARSSKWWIDDKAAQEGLQIENLLSRFSISQEINQPSHIFQNFNSCIDLDFTNQQNLITDSGIHPSLHPNYHHQITYESLIERFFILPRMKDIFGIINMEILI